MKRVLFVLACFAWAAANPLQAQELPQFPAPVKEHEWLKQFVGDWESESEAVAGPGQPPMKCKGTMSSRMLGGFWLVSELTGDLGGAQMTGVQTIGYDQQKKKYVGTWVDSMINHMWKYEGSVDDTGKILTLEAEGRTSCPAEKRPSSATPTSSSPRTTSWPPRQCRPKMASGSSS